MLTLLMMSRMLPGPALMLPIYMMISRMGLIDTRLGLILVHTVFGLPLGAILCASFIRAVPVELEEAAIVDGCSRLQVFLKIVIPLAWIGIASVGIFHFVGSWSEFAFASVLLESQNLRTAPIGLAQFVFQFGNAQFNQDRRGLCDYGTTDYGALYAGAKTFCPRSCGRRRERINIQCPMHETFILKEKEIKNT